MEDTPLTREESLKIIQSMINRAKDNFNVDGQLYLVWGWVIMLASLAEFLLIRVFHVQWHYMVWWIIWVVVIYQVVYIRRQRRQARVRTYMDEILAIVWVSFIVTLFILAIVVGNIFDGQGKDFYVFINPILLSLYGFPTFLSGYVLRFRPLKVGGIACWVFSVVTAFLPPAYQILLLAPAVFLAWVLPGYLLRSRYKRMHKPEHGL